MPKNLKSKILIILEEGETLSRLETATRLEQLMQDELNFLHTEHTIGKRDLNEIKSKAVDSWLKVDPKSFGQEGYGVSDEMRAWAYVDSVISFLRRKGLITFLLNFDHTKK